jgi:hypothetical protein
MRAHRVSWVDRRWEGLAPEDPFHPLSVALDRQGGGRFDNPHRYAALYAATTEQAAVGETFANSSTWLAEEVTRPKEGRPRCLVSLDLDLDATRLLDLDDAHTLVDLGLRPSDVARRNRDHTQEIAQSIWMGRPETDIRGLRWRSYWRVEWEVLMAWSDGLRPPWFPFATVTAVEELRMDLPAVVLAADVLPRLLA